MQVRPSTSPITFMTLTKFGAGRLLSIIARSASLILFAAALALATPPTSGDTTTTSSIVMISKYLGQEQVEHICYQLEY